MKRPDDTSLGGPSPRFPSTIWPVLDQLKRGENREAAVAQLVARYWKPVYAFIRIAWGKTNEDAKDQAQEFFVFLMEGGALAAADPSRGKFRAYLKTVLRNFLAEEHRTATRVKRGGRERFVSMNVPVPDLQLPASTCGDPSEAFDREWARSLVAEALAAVEATLASAGREVHWRVFREHDLAEPGAALDYAGLAKRHALTEHQVKNLLQETRRRVRDSVISKIREYALDEGEVWEELGYLMGLWRP